MKPHQHLSIALIGLVLLSACWDNADTVKERIAPRIVFFETSANEIQPGARVELSWQVQEGRRVVIKEDGVIVRFYETEALSEGVLEVWPTHSVRYAIEVSNGALTASDELDVEVTDLQPNPRVSLSLSETEMLKGEQATLRWSSEATESLELTANGVSIDVPAPIMSSGMLQVSPTESTTFRMTGAGSGGIAVAEASLTVYEQPRVLMFGASGDVVVAGEAVTLQWKTENASQVLLTDDLDELSPISGLEPSAGQFVVRPLKKTVYQLMALGETGLRDVVTVTVDVLQYPRVDSFKASPPAVLMNGVTTLSWRCEWTESVTIHANGQRIRDDFLSEGSVEVRPTVDTVYKLVAEGKDGLVEDEVEVVIIPAVTIDHVSVTPSRPGFDQPATLSWETTGATRIEIFANEVEVTLPSDQLDGQVNVRLTEDTRFLLRANGLGGEVTREVFVEIQEASVLRIVSFTATAESIDSGEGVTLSWQTTSARTLSITSDRDGPLEIGPLVGVGSLQVTPPATTRYTLRISDDAGVAVSRDVVVQVNQPVEIVTFSSSSTEVLNGDSLELSWEVQNAVMVELFYGDSWSVVDAVGTFEIDRLEESAVFVLVAYGLGGQVERELYVEVLESPPLEIFSFEASVDHAPEGAPVLLSWETSAIAEVRLLQQVGEGDLVPVSTPVQSSNGVYMFDMEESVQFVLEVKDIEGEVLTASLEISLLPPLAIESLELSAVEPETGLVLVTWSVVGAVSVTLSVQDGADAPSVALEESVMLSGSQMLELNSGSSVSIDVTNGFEVISETMEWWGVGSTIDPLLLSWTLSQAVVPIDGWVTLSWLAVEGVNLEFLARDDLGVIRERRQLGNFEEGTLTYGPIDFPAKFEIVATSMDGLREESLEEEIQLEGGAPDGLLFSEISLGLNEQSEPQGWFELVNKGDDAVNLWDIGVGYEFETVPYRETGLRGVVRPGECVLVGMGDLSGEADFGIDLSAVWPEGWATSGELSLLSGTSSGSARSNGRLDMLSFGAETFNVNSTTVGAVRDLVTRAWSVTDVLTPGLCFGVSAPGDIEVDPTEIPFRPRGPDAGGNQVMLYGWDLYNVFEVRFGPSIADCSWSYPPEIICEVPAGQGSVPLVVESVDGVITYPEWYTYESIDRCGLETTDLTGVAGESWRVEGWVVESGVTEEDAASGLVGAWGVGPVESDPALEPELWTWQDVEPSGPCTRDERCEGGLWFSANVQTPQPGLFAHVFRFRRSDESGWTYCDSDGTINDEPSANNLMTVEALGRAEVLSE